MGYTNDKNPFGDSNLLQPFVWGKKKEKDTKEGRTEEVDSVDNRVKMMAEIERVRKRREDRELEVEEMDRLRTEEQRLREASQYGDWQAKEEEFHMEQTRVRSKIRIAENREEPIDLMAKNILLIEAAASDGKDERDLGISLSNLEIELRDPVTLVEGRSLPELEKLLVDVDAYLQLEVLRAGAYQEFWQALNVVISAEKQWKQSKDGALHQAVAGEVKKLFIGKSLAELKQLQEDIDRSIREGKRSDVEYWEQMSHAVGVQRAKATVSKTHQSLLEKQLEVLSRLHDEARSASASEAAARSSSSSSSSSGRGGGGGGGSGEAAGGGEKSVDDELFSAELQKAEQGRGFDEMEERMVTRDEVVLPGSTYWWQDKFRPRKPRYFNRVRTGWDWNKYNQTHYDHDNPPPRLVQGYKFTVFYPDLVDKTKTPKYFLEAAEEKEFAILRFHAGAPYEDVAFKILNREWEISARAGFRVVFDRGILSLHFNFKRSFYRR